mmetsp:Transcript_65953/g.157702  ORF Transcript_65953/g.157702 Transcript_65953/m.157702 type:complete len:717 (-) Transcript_65953:64-2214(-)
MHLPADSQVRGRPLSIAGRASVGAPLPNRSFDDKHQEYLKKLQERNLQQRLVREAEEQRNADRLRREQGFSLCFSGANRTKTTFSERQRCPSIDAAYCRQGSGGAAGRQWEEGTVEIRGVGGEVHALRPSGERRCLPPRLPCIPSVPNGGETLSASQALEATLRLSQSSTSFRSPSSPARLNQLTRLECEDGQQLTETQKELQSLLPTLLQAGVVVGGKSSSPTTAAAVAAAAAGEEVLEQTQSAAPKEDREEQAAADSEEVTASDMFAPPPRTEPALLECSSSAAQPPEQLADDAEHDDDRASEATQLEACRGEIAASGPSSAQHVGDGTSCSLTSLAMQCSSSVKSKEATPPTKAAAEEAAAEAAASTPAAGPEAAKESNDPGNASASPSPAAEAAANALQTDDDAESGKEEEPLQTAEAGDDEAAIQNDGDSSAAFNLPEDAFSDHNSDGGAAEVAALAATSGKESQRSADSEESAAAGATSMTESDDDDDDDDDEIAEMTPAEAPPSIADFNADASLDVSLAVAAVREELQSAAEVESTLPLEDSDSSAAGSDSESESEAEEKEEHSVPQEVTPGQVLEQVEKTAATEQIPKKTAQEEGQEEKKEEDDIVQEANATEEDLASEAAATAERSSPPIRAANESLSSTSMENAEDCTLPSPKAAATASPKHPEPPSAAELAERIGRLSVDWREAIAQLLEDAEKGQQPPFELLVR